jgi:hypothetical protein
MTIEELLRDRREKALANGFAPCPFCALGYEIYTIGNDVFKCAICGEHERPCPTPAPNTIT